MRHFTPASSLVALSLAVALVAGCDDGAASEPGPSADAGVDVTADGPATADASEDSAADATIEAGDEATADAAEEPDVVPLPTGTYDVAAAWGPMLDQGAPAFPAGVWGGMSVTFGRDGQLLEVVNPSWTLSTSEPNAEIDADGVVAWGRWQSGTATWSTPAATVEALHYVIGVATGDASKLHASYGVFASGSPVAATTTSVIGAPNSVGGTVTFDAGTVAFTLEHIFVAGHEFSVSATSGLYAGTGFLANGTVTSTTGGCSTGCVANLTNAPLVQGWFYGPDGDRVALQYGFTSDVGTVVGTVVAK